METNCIIISIACASIALIIFLAFAIDSSRKQRRIKGELESKDALDGERLKRIEELLLTIQKALVLSQSKDAESKKALIDLLSEHKPDLKEQAKPIKEKIEKKEKARKEVLGKVSRPYEPVD